MGNTQSHLTNHVDTFDPRKFGMEAVQGKVIPYCVGTKNGKEIYIVHHWLHTEKYFVDWKPEINFVETGTELILRRLKELLPDENVIFGDKICGIYNTLKENNEFIEDRVLFIKDEDILRLYKNEKRERSFTEENHEKRRKIIVHDGNGHEIRDVVKRSEKVYRMKGFWDEIFELDWIPQEPDMGSYDLIRKRLIDLYPNKTIACDNLPNEIFCRILKDQNYLTKKGHQIFDDKPIIIKSADIMKYYESERSSYMGPPSELKKEDINLDDDEMRD